MDSWAAEMQKADAQDQLASEHIEGAKTTESAIHVRPGRQARLDFEEVKAKQAARVAWLYIAIAAPVAWYYLPGTPFAFWPFTVFSVLVITGLLSWYLTSRSPIYAYLILLIGPIIAHALALWSIPSLAVPFFGVLIVVTNAAISPWHGLGAAVLDAICLWYLYSLHPLFWPLILLMALVVVAQFILYQSLYTFLDWSWNSQQRANTLLEQLREQQGRLNRALTALTEATRRLQRTNRELALARQDADEARALREQFVVNISHELRTPLNLIVGFVEMMYLSPDDYEGVVWTPELTADVGRMYRAGNHLESLVNDILDLSRIDTARLPMFRELISLRTIIDEAGETISPLLERNNLSYEVVYDDRTPNLLLDRTRIRQVMLNLLNNAIRFTDEGGIVVRVRRLEDEVEVSVVDTGVGIPPEQIPHIFEKFTQAHVGSNSRGGAGLGLALSKQFVWLHGGSMWVDSTLGQGSTFTFTLPLPGANLVRSEQLRSVPPRPVSPQDTPVLVADPDAGIADMLGRYIGDRRVVPLRNIEELDALIESEHPGAVIHNLLPDTPAHEWLAALGEASARYNVPILRCSIPSPSWLPEMSGIDHCLTKPVSREALRDVLMGYGPRIGRLMIVDDDPGFVSLMERMIGTMDLVDDIRMVYSGAEALRVMETYRPDLVLLDLFMPDTDGFAVIDAMHAQEDLSDTHVVAVTASSYGEEMLVRKGTHFTLTQAKGLSTGKLTDILHAILDIVEADYVRVERTA